MANEEIKKTVRDQEQRSSIRISYLLDLPTSFIHNQLVKALPRKAVSRRTVEQWLGHFRECRIDTSDESVREDSIEIRFWNCCGNLAVGLLKN
jgi:hypothetical protein